MKEVPLGGTDACLGIDEGHSRHHPGKPAICCHAAVTLSALVRRW